MHSWLMYVYMDGLGGIECLILRSMIGQGNSKRRQILAAEAFCLGSIWPPLYFYSKYFTEVPFVVKPPPSKRKVDVCNMCEQTSSPSTTGNLC